jgi:hypothetical protein
VDEEWITNNPRREAGLRADAGEKGREASANRTRLSGMGKEPFRSKRVKGTAEQRQEILFGPLLKTEFGVAVRSDREMTREALMMLARHMDLMRAFIVEEHVHNIPNIALEPRPYWVESAECQIGVAVLEEEAPAIEEVEAPTL